MTMVMMRMVVVMFRVIMFVMIVFRVTVFVIAVIVAGVFVIILMTMRGMTAAGIGAAFGIERRFNNDDPRAEATHHVLDHMIAANAETLADNLGRQMTVAEMPGDTHQMMRIGAANFHQRLGCSDHFDQTAIFQHQRIATAQGNGVFQIKQEFQPARAGHRHAPPMPVIETEDHRIGGGLGPANLRANLRRADHGDDLTASALRRR
jgi:hypothetical protein